MRTRQVFFVLAVVFTIVAVGLTIAPKAGADQQASSVSGEQSEQDAVLLPSDPPADTDANMASVTSPPEEQPQLDLPDLEPGQPAPQFVVVSFDGGVESRDGIMSHYIDLAKKVDGHFSFYLSGVYILPEDQKKVYSPPRHSPGSSDIGFSDPQYVGVRIKKLTEAYNEGDEIGTHFMGHFCNNSATGVDSWTQADWTQEIQQFNTVVDNWRKYSPTVNADPLPFDSSAIKGGRTPCLQGNPKAFTAAFKAAGYRYDSSGIGYLKWPKADKDGFWDLPMPVIQVPGVGGVTAMDFNFLANQNDSKTTAAPEKCQQIEDQSYQAYTNALNAVSRGNRAPLLLGNHMNNWACNAYTKALTRFVEDTHEHNPDVRFISSLDLVNWMERQDPAQLAAWQAKPQQTQ